MLKHLLRKASERTAQGTWTRIGLLNAFTKDECGRYLVNAGYVANKLIPLKTTLRPAAFQLNCS